MQPGSPGMLRLRRVARLSAEGRSVVVESCGGCPGIRVGRSTLEERPGLPREWSCEDPGNGDVDEQDEDDQDEDDQDEGEQDEDEQDEDEQDEDEQDAERGRRWWAQKVMKNK